MVKGCQRKTIHIKDTGSKYYEEAYFVLRPGVSETVRRDNDMISEAIRIAGESMNCAYPAKKKNKAFSRVVSFVAGVISGGVLSAVVLLLFVL